MKHRMMFAARFALVACAGAEGATGPQGPQGPAGPQGTPGVANRIMVTDLSDANGDASAALPASVGNNPGMPPAISCYESSDPSLGIWLAVSDGFSTTSSWCAAALSGGVWTVSTHDMAPGWTAAWVVTY